ncbi:unnamed protein product [Adineta ricciae]|uniref:VWFC domain-containing protein n=1 Tax=Adineta ricciae TaxID=249248 RepID=A0A815UT23_ADIRI|nr:unnamed protein product [Adineta ricciae]
MRLSIISVVVTLIIVGLANGQRLSKRDTVSVSIQTVSSNDILQWICDENPLAPYFGFCQGSTTTTSTASTSTKSGGTLPSQVTSTMTTTVRAADSPTVLERAHWCRYPNGSYASQGYQFVDSNCNYCQCTKSRLISCHKMSCMATYCVDNTAPSRRPGQCCSQCAYETNSTGCVSDGYSFPHGAVIKTTSNKIYCWCQMGTIECRKIGVSLFSGLDVWGEGTAVYFIIIILCVVLILGTLLCGGCSLLYYYYYYYHNQQSAEQAYWDNAGWQPMGEEEQVVDASAEQKKAEAEQSQQEQEYSTGFSPEYVPPPYALYNGTYDNEQANNDQKRV